MILSMKLSKELDYLTVELDGFLRLPLYLLSDSYSIIEKSTGYCE